MTTKTIYVALDGWEFQNEDECREYEQQLKKKAAAEKSSVLEKAIALDELIWKKYHPEYDGTNRPSENQVITYLRNDISKIMLEFPGSGEIIQTIIKGASCGSEILAMLDWEKIQDNVNIRSNFYEALQSVKDGSDLAGRLWYSFSSVDIAHMAELHKSNKCRKKIEDLLACCNFHYESGKFRRHEYDEFLKPLE